MLIIIRRECAWYLQWLEYSVLHYFRDFVSCSYSHIICLTFPTISKSRTVSETYYMLLLTKRLLNLRLERKSLLFLNLFRMLPAACALTSTLVESSWEDFFVCVSPQTHPEALAYMLTRGSVQLGAEQLAALCSGVCVLISH